jgi:hypothetical protein
LAAQGTIRRENACGLACPVRINHAGREGSRIPSPLGPHDRRRSPLRPRMRSRASELCSIRASG